MMNENNKLRLMEMADHIEYNVKDEQFYMGWWKRTNQDCGTVCCAVGHTIHLLPELELVIASPGIYLYQLRNKKAKSESFDAIQDALGLTRAEVLWLFSPEEYEKVCFGSKNGLRLTVARRLRGFAKGELECPPGSRLTE